MNPDVYNWTLGSVIDVIEMTPERVFKEICKIIGYRIVDKKNSRKKYGVRTKGKKTGKIVRIPDYTTNLEDAISLIPVRENWNPDFDECLASILACPSGISTWWYWINCDNRPMAICRACILLNIRKNGTKK